MPKNILIVAPHADDEILGCGGVIAKHIKAGDRVYVFVVTKAISSIFSEEYMVNVRQEALGAHKFLGVTETRFSDFPAPVLDQTPLYEIANAIKGVAENWKIDWAYIPFRGDIHKDHQVVFDASMVAFRPHGKDAVKKIMAYETLSETEWALPFGDEYFKPTFYIGIEDQLKDKLDAMGFFKSQLRPFPASRSLEAIEALAKFRGATVGAKAAEAFMTIREISY